MTNSLVAVTAKNPIARGKALTSQPTVKLGAPSASKTFAMLVAATTNMVNLQKLWDLFPAASTLISIMGKDFSTHSFSLRFMQGPYLLRMCQLPLAYLKAIAFPLLRRASFSRIAIPSTPLHPLRLVLSGIRFNFRSALLGVGAFIARQFRRTWFGVMRLPFSAFREIGCVGSWVGLYSHVTLPGPFTHIGLPVAVHNIYNIPHRREII